MKNKYTKLNRLFKDKLVVFYTSNKDQLDVFSPKIKKINKKLFVIGKIPSKYSQGKDCGVSWKAVTDFVIFNSLKDYKKSCKKLKKKKEKSV